MTSPHSNPEKWEARNLPWLDTEESSLEALGGELDEAVDGTGATKTESNIRLSKSQYTIREKDVLD